MTPTCQPPAPGRPTRTAVPIDGRRPDGYDEGLSRFSRRILNLHLFLGLLCALPLFLWASSGLLGALPRAATTGVAYQKLELERLKVGPEEAARKARELGSDRVSSMTLQQADGKLSWQLVAGGRAVRVDAETGETAWADPPGWTSRYFSQAHFLFFAGPLQQPLLIGFTVGLLALLATGLILAARRLKP